MTTTSDRLSGPVRVHRRQTNTNRVVPRPWQCTVSGNSFIIIVARALALSWH